MSTLAIILNSSPARWSVPPLVEYAMLILPGFALAYAMNCGTDLAGTDGCTTMVFGRRTTAVTGSMSRMKLKLSLSYSVALIAFTAVTQRSVQPSGGAR